MKNELDSIFSEVKNNFVWVSDKETYGIPDKWTIPIPNSNGVIRGDCEDFALYCNGLLRPLNVERFLIYCKTETNEGHMVLGVQLGGDIYVLDNRQRRVSSLKKLKRAGYSDFSKPVGSVAGAWKSIIV